MGQQINEDKEVYLDKIEDETLWKLSLKCLK